MKLKFLLFVVTLLALQLTSVNELKAQTADSTKVTQAADSVKVKVAKPKKLEKLKELPDPLSVGWKKDKMFGDKLFEQGSLYNGLHYYEAAIAKNPKETNLYQQLADGNFMLRDYRSANRYYKMLVDMDTAKHTNWMALYKYALTEKFLGNYEKAKLLFEQFNETYKNSADLANIRKKVTMEDAGCDLGIKFRDDKTFKETRLVHLDTNVNQPFTDYAPVLKDPHTLYFSAVVSDKVILTGKREKFATFSRMYSAKKNSDSSWTQKQILPGEVNTVAYHVGNPTFSANGKTMYYTQCLQDDNQAIKCNIYKSLLGDTGWVAGTMLNENVNAPGATNTQPNLGKNERGEDVLYFVSDRNIGRGTDIFYAKLNSDGTFDKAREISGNINTDGNEFTPNYDVQTNTLYFSSDGHINIGGADVFKTKPANGSWSEPENLGMPINSSVDDMYYSWNEKDGIGFVVSNRPGGYGLKSETCCDDIYQLYRYRIFLAVKGKLVDPDSGNVVKDQVVNLYDANTGALIKSYNSKDGSYFFDLNPDKSYKISVARDGYFTGTQLYNTLGKDKSDTASFTVSMKKMVMNKAYSLSNIYYEYDKADLIPASKLVLDTLYDILKENPTITIELSAHTDSKGADKYNEELSQKRAEACTNYLVNEKGIAKDRIVAKGYGKTMPVAPNTNPDGSDNPEGRAKNRRTEFKILNDKRQPAMQTVPVPTN
jgi:outer membrane protein OmpA-like peptidoglycan-associated protein